MMSFEWTTQPLSIQSIAEQYRLPVIIRSAPGFRGSNRPIVLYSISRISFAYGYILTVDLQSKTGYETYKPIQSQMVAIPLNYSGKIHLSNKILMK